MDLRWQPLVTQQMTIHVVSLQDPRRPGLIGDSVRPYHRSMATPTVKTTYALDLKTIRSLEGLAQRWNVSRSEALRRAIAGRAALLTCMAMTDDGRPQRTTNSTETRHAPR